MIYTQEPWEIHNGSTALYIVAKDGNGEHVTIAQVFPRGVASPEMWGNARLMKAAPKMYRLVEQIANIEQVAGKVCPLCGGYLDHQKDCLFVSATEALAEVEGKEGEDEVNNASSL